MSEVIIQVDAFTNKPFTGNPAAVCVLDTPRGDSWMQNVAEEMNLSETAFLIQQEDSYHLRWFTPTTEVPLCGHATLASAHVLWTEGYLSVEQVARFSTQSGLLTATKKGDWIELDFPVIRSIPITPPPELEDVLAIPYQAVYQNSLGYLVELESEELVKQFQPNFPQIRTLSVNHLIVTSLAQSEYDFVSRFFAPKLGIDEDPVTGIAHCCLAAFWRDTSGDRCDRLKKDEFLAYQASQRGGVVKVGYTGGDRVFLAGQAVTVMRGKLS
jgi:PhzF family phenazine biosynthesis protein